MPALNTNERFIDDLADAVVEALPYVGVMAGAPSDALVPMGESAPMARRHGGAATDWQGVLCCCAAVLLRCAPQLPHMLSCMFSAPH